jgi:hypothetical protein
MDSVSDGLRGRRNRYGARRSARLGMRHLQPADAAQTAATEAGKKQASDSAGKAIGGLFGGKT